jgi:hypothetical protein
MQGIAIGLGIDRNSFNPEFSACPDHPAGDFASICDKHFLEHLVVMR